MSIYKRKYPEQFEELLHKYFFLKSQVAKDQPKLDDPALQEALSEAYKHPWHKLERDVEVRQERNEFTKTMKEKPQVKGPHEAKKNNQRRNSETDVLQDLKNNYADMR